MKSPDSVAARLTAIGLGDLLCTWEECMGKIRPGRASLRGEKKKAEALVSQGLRQRLEARRLDLRALFRSLDILHLAQDIPPELHDLFELDADLVEALWVLDQPASKFDVTAMQRDTEASLAEILVAFEAFLRILSGPACLRLRSCMIDIRRTLTITDAYLQVPGRDPAQELPEFCG